VLELYDRDFRDHASPLTQAAPDLFIDVQNAASMLFRLERLGINVGNRWVELADKAEARIGDCVSAFTLPHRGSGDIAQLVGEIALPISEAVWAHGQGRHAEAVALMRPVLSEAYRLGGSNAQQEVLEQLFLDAALKADLRADVRSCWNR
jgi:hypothetical protein